MAHVRVGIVAWNCADVLRDCLAALPAALGDLDAEVVVVDNASDDGSADVADVAGVAVLRNDANVGYARGMNRALGATDATVLVALNPDTVPPPGSLERLVSKLEARPDVGLVAPLLRGDDGEVQHSVHRFPSVGRAAMATLLPTAWLPAAVRDRLWLRGAVRPGRSGPVDFAIGAVHVLRAAAVPDPPYDERWFIYVEDLDLCARLADAGWIRWLAADVEVVHVGNVSGAQAFGGVSARRWWNETYDWYGRRHGALAVRAYALVNALAMGGRLLPAAVRSVRDPRHWRLARTLIGLARLHGCTVRRGRPDPLPPPGTPHGRGEPSH